MKRCFESGDRFWDVELDGSIVISTQGKIGTAGKKVVSSFKTAAEAEKFFVKRAANKTAAGFFEVIFPFPFFGVCFDHYFQYAEILVRFEASPTEHQRELIIARAPSVIVPENLDFRGKMLLATIPKLAHISIEKAYGDSGIKTPEQPCDIDPDDMESVCEDAIEKLIQGSVFEASRQALHAFEADSLQWLRDIHSNCPVEFACCREDGRDIKKRQIHWHISSQCGTRRLISRWTSDSITYSQDNEERAIFRKALDEIFYRSKILISEVPDQLVNFAFPNIKMFKLLSDGHQQAGVEIFLRHCYDDDIQRSFHRYLYNLDPDVPSRRKELIEIIKYLLFVTEPDSYGLPDLIAKVAHAAVLEDDEKMIGTVIGYCTGLPSKLACKCVENINSYAYERLKSGDYRLVRGLYEMVMALVASREGAADLSLYCNALWVLQKDNTGVPVDPQLNEKFLVKCLPYGPANPAIYFNAACLYVEMGDFDRALECVDLARKNHYDNYDYMIRQIKKEAMFREFRKNSRVKELIKSMHNGVAE